MRPKVSRTHSPGDIRSLRSILSDVSLLTLAASGRVSVPTAELTDAFSRVLLWRARVVGGLTSVLLEESTTIVSTLSPPNAVVGGDDDDGTT